MSSLSGMKKSKTAIKSKQNWLNIGMVAVAGALSAISPDIAKALSEHPTLALAAISAVNIAWRTFVTKEPIEGILHSK